MKVNTGALQGQMEGNVVICQLSVTKTHLRWESYLSNVGGLDNGVCTLQFGLHMIDIHPRVHGLLQFNSVFCFVIVLWFCSFIIIMLIISIVFQFYTF